MVTDIHFAPLQGYTDDAYRRIHREVFGGVAAYYSPFVRLEHGDCRSKDMRDVKPEYNEGVNMIPQVICRDGEELRILLEKLLPLGYKRIDINMGCPFPLQTRHGRGAGLLSTPDKVREIVMEAEKHPDITFSVKMRLGMTDSSEWRNVLPILNTMPLAHVTLHPRIASQQYKGEVNMEEFEAFISESAHPVIYNGDITSVEDIHTIVDKYATVTIGGRQGLAGVMIGRGMLARPSLAMEYTQGVTLTDSQLIENIRLMHSKLMEHYSHIIPGEAQLLSKLRSFWDYLEPTIGRKPWKKITKAGNMKNYLAQVAVFS